MCYRNLIAQTGRSSFVGACLLACSCTAERAPSRGSDRTTNACSVAAASRAGPQPVDARATTPAPIDVAASDQPRDLPLAPEAVPKQAPTWDPGLANLNPDDDDVVAPPDAIVDCAERLKAAGVSFGDARLPIIKKRGFVCGAPQVVEYADGPEHIRYRPHPVVTCQLALALAHFERVVARTAAAFLGARVTSIAHGGTYSCRAMARFQLVSEHSYANAIDLRSFGLSDGRTVSVLKDFGHPKDEATTSEARFLRSLAQQLFDENVFSVVITRHFDELHRDHIHVDMAHYRTDGSR